MAVLCLLAGWPIAEPLFFRFILDVFNIQGIFYISLP